MMFKLKEYNKYQTWKRYAFNVSTPYEYYEGRDSERGTNWCMLNIAFGKHSWWWQIPQIFKPLKKWVDTSKESWSKNPKGGYWEHIRREYGFTITDENIHLHYGIQPGCWSSRDKKNSDHTKLFGIPWLQKRYVHEKFYRPDWKEFGICEPKKNGGLDFDLLHKIKDMVPKIKFRFNDFDGEEIIATCYISEMRHEHGTGWFKWLKYFVKPMITRRLDLEFNKEIGYEKGSWKGGTMGHSVKIEHGEDPLQAFIRYGTSEDSYKYHGTKNRGFTNIVRIE
jgi:hypothetical protein